MEKAWLRTPSEWREIDDPIVNDPEEMESPFVHTGYDLYTEIGCTETGESPIDVYQRREGVDEKIPEFLVTTLLGDPRVEEAVFAENTPALLLVLNLLAPIASLELASREASGPRRAFCRHPDDVPEEQDGNYCRLERGHAGPCDYHTTRPGRRRREQ